MSTQWRVVGGMGGLLYVGLDYNTLRLARAEHRELPRRCDLARLMPQLRTIEQAALKQLNAE